MRINSLFQSFLNLVFCFWAYLIYHCFLWSFNFCEIEAAVFSFSFFSFFPYISFLSTQWPCLQVRVQAFKWLRRMCTCQSAVASGVFYTGHGACDWWHLRYLSTTCFMFLHAQRTCRLMYLSDHVAAATNHMG